MDGDQVPCFDVRFRLRKSKQSGPDPGQLECIDQLVNPHEVHEREGLHPVAGYKCDRDQRTDRR